jgi:hypothetical protein
MIQVVRSLNSCTSLLLETISLLASSPVEEVVKEVKELF